MLRELGLLLAGLLACSSTASDAECAARVAEMRALFALAPENPIVINTKPGVELPQTTRGEQVPDGMPVFLFADGSAQLYESPHASAAEFLAALEEEFDKSRLLDERTNKPFAPKILLVADARTPTAAIRELAAGVPPETRFFVIADLAGDVVPTPPPTPEAVRQALASPVEQRSARVADVIAPALGSCTAARDVFKAVVETSADRRDKVLLDGLPTAVETCRCKQDLDLDVLVSAVWTMTGKTTPERRALPLALSRDPAAEAVPLPATVADLVRLVEARGPAPFRLESK